MFQRGIVVFFTRSVEETGSTFSSVFALLLATCFASSLRLMYGSGAGDAAYNIKKIFNATS